MHRILLFVAATTLLASGCTSVPTRDAARDGVDSHLVAAIDRAARTRGVEIHWVNYPQRRSTAQPVVVEPILPTGT